MPCPQKRPSPAHDNPPAFGSGCSSNFRYIPTLSPNSVPDGIPDTDFSAISCFPDTLHNAPRMDPTKVYPLHNPPLPSSAYSLSFADFPTMSDVPFYSAQAQCAYVQGQNGNMSSRRQHQSSPAPSESRSVFDRLQHTPVQQQQASSSIPQQRRSQTPTQPNLPQPPQGIHDLPPGFATPEGLPAGAGDFPPGFKSPVSSSASQSASRSRMRSDQMAAPAQPQQSTSRPAHLLQAASGHGGPPGGPPGFGGLPAYLAQRLSPSPAQKPAALPDQAGPQHPRATSSSPEYGKIPGHNSHQHLPAGAYDASSDDSSDEEPPGFVRANNTAGQHGQGPAASSPEPGRQPPRQVQRGGPSGYGNGRSAPNDNSGVNQVQICCSRVSKVQPAHVAQCQFWQNGLQCLPASGHLHMMTLMDPSQTAKTAGCFATQGWWTLISCREQHGTRARSSFPLSSAFPLFCLLAGTTSGRTGRVSWAGIWHQRHGPAPEVPLSRQQPGFPIPGKCSRG